MRHLSFVSSTPSLPIFFFSRCKQPNNARDPGSLAQYQCMQYIQCYYWTRLICCVTQTTTVGDLRKRQYVAGQWTMASTGSQDVMSALTRTGLYRSRRLANIHMSLHCAARRYQTVRGLDDLFTMTFGSATITRLLAECIASAGTTLCRNSKIGAMLQSLACCKPS